MVKCVEVLLSVYKPEWRFLEEQLNSVFDQKSVAVKLLVRDDSGEGSDAVALRRFFQDKFPQEDVVVIGGDNLGPAESFLELCYRSDMKSDYYAFCDQDDLWNDAKLIRAITCIESEKVGMYASTLDITDQNLNVIYRSKKPKMIDFENSLTENVVTGCTIVFKREIMEIVKACKPGYVSMHDHWLYMISTAFSRVYFDGQSFINYRQHGGNVVGAKGGYYYAKKLAFFGYGVFKGKKRTSDQVESFYLCYEGMLEASKKKQCEQFLGVKNNFIQRLLCFNSYSRNGFIENVIFRIKFILGAY